MRILITGQRATDLAENWLITQKASGTEPPGPDEESDDDAVIATMRMPDPNLKERFMSVLKADAVAFGVELRELDDAPTS